MSRQPQKSFGKLSLKNPSQLWRLLMEPILFSVFFYKHGAPLEPLIILSIPLDSVWSHVFIEKPNCIILAPEEPPFIGV
jgi:hypothetical protein